MEEVDTQVKDNLDTLEVKATLSQEGDIHSKAMVHHQHRYVI